METTATAVNKVIPISPNTKLEEILRVYDAQQKNRQNVKNTSAKERKAKLKKLKDTVLEYRPKIEAAVYADLHKPSVETSYAEIFNVVSECRFAIENLDEWMEEKQVDTPLLFVGTSSKIISEPKGVCLILTPWNYPFQMPAQHLVGCIAAGNTAIIKPSEFTPNTGLIVKEIMGKVFAENEVAVVLGDYTVSTELLKLKFDHIHFTGSPAVGKTVMRAASEYLTSVTLELGGKSPAVVDDTANLAVTVKKLTWGKFLNAGQTCIAPDYILIDEKKKEEFLKLAKARVEEVFGADPQKSADYGHIVNNKHFNRVKGLLEDALSKGAKIVVGGKMDEADNFISPTIISDVPANAKILEEEIFGPIMPVVSYKNIPDALNIINGKEKPLAMYIFSTSNKNQKELLNGTSAGGTCINDNLVHISQPNLPFGGVNNSGIGQSFGYYAFKEFSHQRSVLTAMSMASTATPLWQPYGKLARKLTDIMLKYF
jgi:aldehyde dehydrogenase (NAD+)